MKKIIIPFVLIFFPVLLNAQVIKALRSINIEKFPKLVWYTTYKADSLDFKIYRMGSKNDKYNEIKPYQYQKFVSDTLEFIVIDTTLTRKGLYKYYITATTSKGLVITSEVMLGHNMGNIHSPQVTGLTAESSKNRKAIELKWKLNYNFTVRNLVLYRSMQYDKGFIPIATLSAEAESYIDPVERSNEAYFYFIQVCDFFGLQKPSIRVYGICTLNEKAIPPQEFTGINENNKIKFSWRGVGNNILSYRIYRSQDNSKIFSLISDNLKPKGGIETYTDTTISKNSNDKFRYYAVSVSDGFLESNHTDTLTFEILHDIVLSPPNECNALIDSTGNTQIIWTPQNENLKAKGFNIYRKGPDNKTIKLNKQVVPAVVNYFTDTETKEEGQYEYQVETVSITNTPSKVRTKTFVKISIPHINLILSLKQTDKGIQISGEPLALSNIKEVILLRANEGCEIKILTKLSPTKINFTDVNIKKNTYYTYSATAVFKNGLKKVINTGVGIRYSN